MVILVIEFLRNWIILMLSLTSWKRLLIVACARVSPVIDGLDVFLIFLRRLTKALSSWRYAIQKGP